MANHEQKPVYMNNDMFKATYKRTYSGDYRCSSGQVKSRHRDQNEERFDPDRTMLTLRFEKGHIEN